MRRETPWIVEADDDGIRPAGPPDRCFYCGVKAGEGKTHLLDCVIRTRTVVVRAQVDYVIRIPESWTAADVEFHRNEGTWCANNGMNELDHIIRHRVRAAYEHAGEDVDSVLGSPLAEMGWSDAITWVDACGQVAYLYVREATVEEEARDGVPCLTSTSRAVADATIVHRTD
jgi:hypothetical protein